MSKPQSEFFVVGITHVDLAWKRGQAEMSEMLEIVVVRLLDALEQFPEFKYHIEQAAHYRELARRRPDLVARLTPFIQAGRVEFVGGMASTLENNLPNGECFIRNQQMGLRWVRETWGVEIKTGWLVDTFGINAQVPQILRGFGITQLMANRFGGSHTHDLFRARGLDGCEITVAGWGTYAAYMRPENLSEKFCKDWDDIAACFAKADTLTGPGPFMVIPYTENEYLISLRPLALIEQRRLERPEQTWQMATPADFFAAVEKTGRALPLVDGDLNPEFTGCFSLRHAIRLKNRCVETRLLEAEKWAALAGVTRENCKTALEEAWWKLHYVQFHDVFTGSHPTIIFHEVMQILGEIEAAAEGVLTEAFARFAPPTEAAASGDAAAASVLVFNGLPHERSDIVEIPLPAGWLGVASISGAGNSPAAFDVQNGVVRVAVETPATGYQAIRLEKGTETNAAPVAETVQTATLENDTIRLDFDPLGIAKLTWKPTGAVLMESGNWLIAQRDDGNFQIENPAGPEVAAQSGTVQITPFAPSPLGQTVVLSGEFPPLSWAGPGNYLRWEAEFFLPLSRAEVRLRLRLDWKGEATRLRLALPTQIDTSSGIYEIPFGVVSRKPYSPRTNAKGEWPAHRFVAMEDTAHGLALVNTGTGGVEGSGGTLYTTLLRAPKGEYSGMVSDDSSSQHGQHNYQFSLVPYAGSWANANVARTAQELNNPLFSHTLPAPADAPPTTSYLRLKPASVVLSGVKAASDGSGDLIVRVYETTGQSAETLLTLPPGAGAVSVCDLHEAAGETVFADESGVLHFTLKPFEIRSFRKQKAGIQ